MLSLAAAAFFFVGIHLLISGTALRARLVAQLGEKTYLGLFSLLSAGGLTWLILAFLKARILLPTALYEWRALALLLNLIAIIFICFGVLAKNPAGLGGERYLDEPDPAKGLQRITRHPMLWGIALWAGTHCVFNPQAAPLWFFGAFLVLAVLGPLALDRKRAVRLGERWARYVALTSNIPFAAIVGGRNRLVWRELLALPLWVALAATAAFTLLHRLLFGIAVVPA